MGENTTYLSIKRQRRSARRSDSQIAEATGRRLLEIIVYSKSCRIGGQLELDDLIETSEIGDWKMPDFRMACTYASSQGWLIVKEHTLTLTTAGLAAA